MPDKTQVMSYVTALLERVINGIDKTVEFGAAQLPLFVEEYIRYAMVVNWIGVVICLLALIGVFWVSHKWAKDTEGASWLLGCLVGTLPTAGFFIQLNTALMATLAPRVFLIKELVGMVK